MTRLQGAFTRVLLNRLSPAGAGGRLSIAIFHRVLPEPDALFPEDVDQRQFNEVCSWFAALFNVLPLREAVQRLRSGTLPARALSITFDDGYADNHNLAMPILRSHGLSATFFIATGFLDGGRMWNDTVVETLRRCAQPHLDAAGLGMGGVGVLDLSSTAARRRALHQVLNVAKYLPLSERQAAVDALAARARVNLPSDLMMRSEQVRAMATGGMDIGAHTVNHPILSRLDEAAALDEMRQSKARLEQLVAAPVLLFAYPNGRPGRDYLPRDVALARLAGFDAAVSTAPGAAKGGDDLFQLPRFTPWDRGRTAFSLRMSRNLLARTAQPT